MIRKIYLSHKYGNNLDMINNINNTAKNMMNSVNVITKNYIKKWINIDYIINLLSYIYYII
jgi:hypothetical protein